MMQCYGMLIQDQFRAYVTDTEEACVPAEHQLVCCILGGLTSALQPLDVLFEQIIQGLSTKNLD